MKSKQQILADILEVSVRQLEENPNATLKTHECWQAMEEYAKIYHEYHRIKLTDDHCICTGDQYGWATNPKCLIHGNK